jgi:hypothetical protein
MVSYMHVPLMIVSVFVVLEIWRFWYCIERLGFIKEVGRRAPGLIHGDILAVTFAAMPFVLAITDWFQVIPPNQTLPLLPVMTVFMSIACLGGCLYVLRNSKGRIVGHWAGTREAALRTVAALQIIDAAELAYALNVIHKYSAKK